MKLIKLDKDKNIIPKSEITYYINPDYIFIPIDKKNILVNQNEFIYKNDLVGKNNIYSPISGKAYGLKICNVNDKKKNTLVIVNDYRELSKKEKFRNTKLNITILLNALASLKNKELLNKFKSKSYDTIAINALDDNPYVYNKVYALKENIIQILDFLESLHLIYATTNILLIVKNTEAFVIDECLKLIGTYPNIKLTLVEDKYLLESNLLDILKLNNNTLFLNVLELLEIIDALNNNMNTTKIITISGDAIKESKVFRVKKYTLLKDVIDKFINITSKNYKVIINGLMTGYEINNIDNFIISDEVYSVNIMKNFKNKEESCINCGKCINICPKKVNPLTLENKKECIDCGLCTYICPVYINLRKKLKEARK